MLVRMTSGSLALFAFSVAIFRGLWVDNPVTTILLRAWYALMIFMVVGALIGYVAKIVLEEHFKDRTKQVLEKFNQEQSEQGLGEQLPEDN